jgi:beta-N-acetylhexosaminidase
MQAEGVIATAKHFPGHGDTRVDSHNTVPVIAHPIERMNSVELLPFRAAIEADVKAVLSAHIIFEALDGEHPATISRRIMDGLLRSEMGFDGLIITDAMDIYAVAREGTTESLSGALKAGVDLVMLGHIDDQLNLNRQFQGQESIEALARILDVAQKLPRALPPLAVVGCKEHQDIAQTIANRSITMVSDNGRLPLRLSPDDELAVVSVSPADLTPADTSALVKIELADAVKKRHVRVSAHELPYRASAADIHRLVEATETAKQIVVGTINASHDPSQAAFVRALVDRGQQPVVVALRTPYDITAFPMVQTYLCAYSIRHVSTEAAAKVLFGEIEAQGVLPCAIPKAAL